MPCTFREEKNNIRNFPHQCEHAIVPVICFAVHPGDISGHSIAQSKGISAREWRRAEIPKVSDDGNSFSAHMFEILYSTTKASLLARSNCQYNFEFFKL